MDYKTIQYALMTLRPGAIWNLRGTTIEWLDASQTQPTDDEIAIAVTSYVPTPSLSDQITVLQTQVAALLAAQGK